VQNPSNKTYEVVQLQVQSNHGYPKYTCVYRFRVHGAQPGAVSAVA
jgi:hypothetical protein